MDSKRIEIIGALDPARAIAPETIMAILELKETALKHGEQFTGRPATRIFTDLKHVIKFKADHSYVTVEARRWVEKMITEERRYGIHHPRKTWFLITSGSGAIIANITPMLSPLHLQLVALDQGSTLSLIDTMTRIYLDIAARFEKRLDEGLSNFGVDTDGTLHYLDDDLYEWDDFTGFCAATGILILKLNQLEPQQWRLFGERTADMIIARFGDCHWIAVIIEHLKSIFVANEAQMACRDAFFAGLQSVVMGKREHSIAQQGVRSFPAMHAPSGDLESETIAILGDIHSNYPALCAVFDTLAEMGVSDGVVLGDVVGYGPHPLECIERLNASPLHVIKGNHDHGAATGNTSRGLANLAGWAIDWTRERLPQEHRHWLDSLPLYIRRNNWLALHGAPIDKTFFNAYIYRMTYEENLRHLCERAITLCFHGHTHIQSIYHRSHGNDGQAQGSEFPIAGVTAALICPGSVGKTRSGSPLAEFATYNRSKGEIRFHRISYDVGRTIKDMVSLGFPAQLIERLQNGQ